MGENSGGNTEHAHTDTRILSRWVLAQFSSEKITCTIFSCLVCYEVCGEAEEGTFKRQCLSSLKLAVQGVIGRIKVWNSYLYNFVYIKIYISVEIWTG